MSVTDLRLRRSWGLLTSISVDTWYTGNRTDDSTDDQTVAVDWFRQYSVTTNEGKVDSHRIPHLRP